jgi:hypothetical protein
LIGKQSFFNSIGSRYVVVKDTYDLYTGLLYAQTVKASENAFGLDQESFVVQRLEQSTATHKVLVSSYSLISMQLDLTHVPGVPAQFARNFYFDVDQWDGFPNKRAELYARLAGVTNIPWLGPFGRTGGFPAWLLWLGIHIVYLIGFTNRVVVIVRWAWSFLTGGRGSRLITGQPLLPEIEEPQAPE